MKRLLVCLSLLLMSALLPLGCMQQAHSPTSEGENAKILSIYNYSTYIDPSVLTQFEKQFGVKIQYDTYETVEDLYAKIKPGNPGYDLIFPSNEIVKIMAQENLLETLDIDKIPNIKNIDKKFLDPPFDPGNKYSLPYQWGTLGIGYNIKKTGGELSSWEAIFDPKYRGRVAYIDELRYMLGAVLIYLGYDPNTTSPQEITQAKDYILKHRDTIAAFAPDTGQLLLDQGEADMAVEWSGDIFQVMAENLDLRYVIPQEGSLIWIDNLAIPTKAPHKELAEKFINFIFEPDISAKIANFIKYGTPNQAAIAQGLIDKKDLENPAIYPPPEVMKKLTYLKDVGEAARLYDQAWTEIKVGVGK
jgi:spermidine/putrescine transport system substrate-binding protein